MVYYGGVEHEIRKEVWPFLLGHYKFGMDKKDMAQVKKFLKLCSVYMAFDHPCEKEVHFAIPLKRVGYKKNKHSV